MDQAMRGGLMSKDQTKDKIEDPGFRLGVILVKTAKSLSEDGYTAQEVITAVSILLGNCVAKGSRQDQLEVIAAIPAATVSFLKEIEAGRVTDFSKTRIHDA